VDRAKKPTASFRQYSLSLVTTKPLIGMLLCISNNRHLTKPILIWIKVKLNWDDQTRFEIGVEPELAGASGLSEALSLNIRKRKRGESCGSPFRDFQAESHLSWHVKVYRISNPGLHLGCANVADIGTVINGKPNDKLFSLWRG